MESIAKYLSLLAVCVILVHHQTVAQTSKTGKELISDVCAQTPNTTLCMDILTSDPSSGYATLQDLAMISLRVSAANATGILTDVKVMIDNPNLDPGIQQGLADCKETLLDAEGQLEDTLASLLTNAEQDAQLWLQAALAAIDTCDASIPGDDDPLSVRSRGFRQLCNIALVISKAMLNNGP